MDSRDNGQTEHAKEHPKNMREDERRNAMSALARKRWEKVRAAQSSGPDDPARDDHAIEVDAADAIVHVPIDIALIVRALRDKARHGEVAAARELREWLKEFPPDDAAASVEQLDRATRKQVRAVLAKALQEIERRKAGALPSTSLVAAATDVSRSTRTDPGRPEAQR
jgi:hypothetical protein